MKTKTTFILSLTAILTLVAGSSFGKYSGGTGETDDPYRIASASDLTALAGDTGDYGKAFILTGDIDLEGVTVSPVGDDSVTFTGVFDGNDHIIRNIVTNTAGSITYASLFGWVGPGGQVKNLGIVNANIHGEGDVGCLVGYNEGAITSCYTTGVVVGADTVVGGLVGYNWVGTITSCYTTCSVSGGVFVGGLAGINYGEITSCYATGAVSGATDVGGLVGYNSVNITTGTITSCYSTGAVSGSAEFGGLVGRNDAPDDAVTACFWDTQTSGQDTSDGGTGKTTAEMKTLSTFTSAGWDFVGETANGPNDIWKMPFDGGYPLLSWQNIVTIGKATTSWELPLDASSEDSRTQTIYLASEIGGEKTLISLALDVTALPTPTLSNFTIRLKHTNLASYTSNLWEFDGWTTVYQSDETISATGWRTFTFTTPFAYNGTDNLMVDISYGNSSSGTYGQCRYSEPGGTRTIYDVTTSGYGGNPLFWSGDAPTPISSTYVPNIRLGFVPVITVTVNVPDIVGLTQADANTAITSAGLIVGTITTDYNDTVAAGNVISQYPAAGTSALPGSAVDFVISLGRWMDITVTKCTVAAGSKYLAVIDKISFSGMMDANANDILAASPSQIVITVDSDDLADPCVMTFPINATTFKKGSYNYTIKGAAFRSTFKFSTKTGKFSLSAKNIDLTGLACPVTITIQIGGSSGSVSLDETIVNGTKKLIPYQLMMDVQNSLVADKVRFKRSSKPDANSLTVSGRFTTAGGPNLANPMVITVGSQTFTVTGNQFLSKKGVVSCSKAVSIEAPLVRVTAKLDYVKCTFAISVKYASITQSGVVDFGIDCFGVNLDGLETIDLGP